MAIDVIRDEMVSLGEATRILPKINGRGVNVSTLWRWCRRGFRGIRLEHVRLGRRIATSPDALSRFIAAVTADDVPAPTRRTRRQGEQAGGPVGRITGRAG